MVKVLLVYDGDPFWPDGDVLFTESRRTRGWPLMFVNMHRINGLNGVVAMLASYAANLADSMTDEAIVERGKPDRIAASSPSTASPYLAVTEKLATIVGAEKLKKHRLTFTNVTRWRNDPSFRGTYSYGKIGKISLSSERKDSRTIIFFTGMTTKDAFAIRQPISRYIFFAGEHTQLPEGESGTVLAAYASGLRVADEILKANGNSKARRDPQKMEAKAKEYLHSHL